MKKTVKPLTIFSLSLLISSFLIFFAEGLFIAAENDYNYDYITTRDNSSYELVNYCTTGNPNSDFISLSSSALFFYQFNDNQEITTAMIEKLNRIPCITDGDNLFFVLKYEGNIKKINLSTKNIGTSGFSANISIKPVSDAKNKVLVILKNVKVHHPEEFKGEVSVAGGTAQSQTGEMARFIMISSYDLYYSDFKRVLFFLFDNKEFLIALISTTITFLTSLSKSESIKIEIKTQNKNGS